LLTFINDHSLDGTGIGYVDAQLLAATRLTPDASLWTNDKRLAAAATRMGIAMRAAVGGGAPNRPAARRTSPAPG
jgi:hypothetical protein